MMQLGWMKTVVWLPPRKSVAAFHVNQSSTVVNCICRVKCTLLWFWTPFSSLDWKQEMSAGNL